MAKRAHRRKASKTQKAKVLNHLFYGKKDWKMWVIVYGGIAMILYGGLYFFTVR